MTINNPSAFVASLWDWAILDGCFGNTHIRPTDIDGLVERNGHFLYLETKLPGTATNEGQERTWTSLVATKKFAVLVIWGYPGHPVSARLLFDGQVIEYDPCDIDKLREIVKRWYAYAEKTKLSA